MTVIELMERTMPGWQNTNLALNWIQEAIEQMQVDGYKTLVTEKTSIVADQRYYDYPSDMITLVRMLQLDEDTGLYRPMSKIENKSEMSEDLS
jgi:hypothetical protein